MLSLFTVVAAGALLAEANVVLPRGVHQEMLADSCDFVADVAQVVDVSWSERDNVAELKADSKAITDYVAAKDDWRTALATFIDKPIAPLGWGLDSWKDFCMKINSPFVEDPQEIAAQINTIYLAGGYDFPEAQLEGILRAVLSDEIGWRAGPNNAFGVPIQRVVVVATDSIPHLEGDAAAAAAKLQAKGESIPTPTANNLSASDMTKFGANFGCSTLDYPSIAAVGNALRAANVIPAFLVAPAVYECGSGQCVYPEMKTLAKERGNPDYAVADKGMVLYYTDLVEQLGVKGVVVPMGAGFAGIGDAFIEAMKEIGTIPEVCTGTTTTTTATPWTTGETVGSIGTPVPTTATTATPPPTTTTTTTTPPPTTTTTTPPPTTTTTTTTPPPTTTTTTTTPPPTTTTTTTTWTTGETVGSIGTPVPTTATTATPPPTTTTTTTTPPPTTTTTTTRTTPAPVTTTAPDCPTDGDCTMKIDMVIEKCNGEKVVETLIV